MLKAHTEATSIDTFKFTMSVIGWCMCVMTACAVIASYKWLDAGGDWAIDLPVALIILVALAFGVLCFLSAVGQLQVGLPTKTAAHDPGVTHEKT